MNTTDKADRAYRLRWWTLCIVAISVMNVMFDTTIVNIALPTFQRELGTTQTQLQWIVNSSMIILGALMLITGPLGDRWGRARMLQLGLLGYIVASIAASFAESGNQLIFWRSVMGIGGAMILPATLAIITNVFPREEQGKAIGVWAGVNAIGIAVGPILAGLIIENLHWGWVFLVNVPLAVIALIGGFWLVPNSRDPNPRKLDILGALLSTTGLALLIFGLVETGRVGIGEPVVFGSLVASTLLLIGFFAWQKQTNAPLVDLQFFTKPRFSIGIAALSLMGLAMMGINFTLTLYMQFVQLFTPLETGIRFIPIAVGLFLGAGVSDRIVGRLGTTKVLVIGFLGVAIMSVLAAFSSIDSPYVQIGLIIFGWGLSLGFIAATATDAVMGSLPKEQAGVGSALNIVSRMVAGSLGVAILVSVLGRVYSESFRSSAQALVEVPADILALAQESVGAAVVLSQQIPGDAGITLLQIAGESFMDGWQIMAFIVCGIALAGALLVGLFMPARDQTPGEQPEAASVTSL